MRVVVGSRLRPGAGLRLSAARASGLPPAITDVYGLSFPNNENVAGAPPAGQMFAFTFTGTNLPDAWPLTVIWKAKYNTAQRGYVTNFFWSTLDTGAFSSADYYWGIHPYPVAETANGADHEFSIATDGFDDRDWEGTASVPTVEKDRWYTHAARVRLVNTDETETDFFFDAGLHGLSRVISRITVSNWAGTHPPPNPGMVWGDAPWAISTERLGGVLGPVKIFNAFLSDADIPAEVDDMTQIVTSAGSAARWWFKPTFDSADDLTDPVTGKSAAWWNASYKATRVQL